MTHCRWYVFSCIGILIWHSYTGTQEVCSVPLHVVAEEHLESCKRVFGKAGGSIRVVLSADIPGMQSELTRMLQITEEGLLTEKACIAGIHLLARQQRFELLKIIDRGGDAAGHDHVFEIQLHASWIVERVVLSGTLIGKERMRQAYLLVAGDRFDKVKHEAGVARICSVLRDEGYLKGNVEVWYEDDEQYKLRVIHLNLKQGAPFTIVRVGLTVAPSEHVPAYELGRMQRKIRKLFQQQLEGVTYHSETINHATRSVHAELADRGFLHVRVLLREVLNYESNTVELTFEIQSGAQHRFEFYGNTFFSRQRLLDQMTLFGSSAALVPPGILAEEIITLYKKFGFWHASVTWSEDATRTFFFIQEGTRIYIQDVELCGVTAFAVDELVQAYFRPLLGAMHFQEDHVKQALEQLTQHYIEAGFWDVTIVGYTVRFDATGYAHLVVTLKEGERRWLKSVELDKGWCSIPLDIQPYLNLASPLPFDVGLLQKQRTILLSRLRAEGRLYVVPIPEMVCHGSGLFTIRWNRSGLDEVVRVGPTVLWGAGRIDPCIILRERTYREGEVWEHKTLETTAARLKNLGIFKSVSVVPDDITMPECQKKIIIRCIPDEPYELRARIGLQGVNRNVVKWNGGASPKVGVSFIAKNPMGIADVARLDIDYTRYMHDVIARYRAPWLGETRLDSEFQVYSSRYDQPVYLGSPEVLYRASRDGFLITVHKPFDIWTGALATGIVWERLEAPPCGCAANTVLHAAERSAAIGHSIDASPLLFAKKYAHICLEATLMCDQRDNQLNPNMGPLTVFSARGVIPPGLPDGSFLKLLFEQSYFFSVTSSTVCGLKIRAGGLFGADFNRIMPPERFYLGGAYSLRSYEADYAPPLRSFVACSGRNCFVPTGGNGMCNGMAELRFPVYGRLSGVIFSDVGLLSARGVWELVRPHNLMVALGAGLRVNTPVGAIRFDLSIKLQRDATVEGIPVHDHRYAWFLTLGQAF